jgi:phage terminase large subunit
MPARPLVQASQSSLEALARLRAQKEALEARKLARLDVFSLIGYEPNCLPRFAERKRIATAMGVRDPFDRQVTEAGGLPEPCGKCPQELFHTATEFDLLFGGSAGGGKSVALVAEGLKWCARHAGLRVLLVRRSYDELEESIFPALRKFGNGEALGARFNKVTRELSFPNGSLFRFRYLETVDDAARRQGGEAQLLLVDEYTLLSPGIVDFLRFERLRSGAGQPVIGVRCTANPGGIGHSAAVTRYIEPTEYGRRIVTDEHGLTVRFIPARATQNPHLDSGYVKRLDAIPDPNRRAAMRDGDWSVFSGMVFPDFNPDRHVVEPIGLPASWLRYSSVDWGYTAPWAVLWAAVDEDSRAWIYREIYEKGVGEEEQARRILAAENDGEHITARWADDAMWALRGDAKPISSVYADGGVHLTAAGKGPGSRVQGWQRWHSYLAEDPACPHHRAQGWETCPKIHIFSTCRNLIREIRSLPYATVGNLEDSDPKADDHSLDAGRYLLINLGGGAQWFDSTPSATPLSPGGPLAPLGKFAVRDTRTPQLAAASAGPGRRQGGTQTWEDALAASQPT